MSNDEFDIFNATDPDDLLPQEPGDPARPGVGPLEQGEDLDYRPRILVIDDDPGVRNSLELALQQDYRPLLCASGDEGLTALEERVAAVILDIKMDRRDGFEIFKEIKSRFLHLPIIFHSAYQDLKNPFEIINEYRPFGYITKGGGSRELLDTIDSAVDYYRQIRRNGRLVQRLQTVNSRLEVLIRCTREMSRVRDGLSALRIAAGYLRESLPALGDLRAMGFVPRAVRVDDDAGFMSGELEERASGESAAGTRPAPPAEAATLSELCEIKSEDDRFWMPALYEERLLGALAWEVTDQPPELAAEEREFAGGILYSLGLALENLRRAEEQRLASIGRMASGIVHDLKNHVTIIQGSSELAGDGDTSEEERREYLQLIHSESRRMLEMAYDILDFARGELKLQRRKIDLQEYVVDLDRSLRPGFDERNLEFVCKADTGASVLLDGDRFRRVIFNIAGNALDALGESGGRFEITAEHKDHSVLFRFADDGPGIPPEIRDRLFQPFVSQGKAHGTGLGLAMVKYIVDAHEGTIRCDSAPGTGTTFLIELPE